MTCHPTDPDVKISDRGQAAGYRPAPEHARTKECVGAQILVQRECVHLQEDCDANLALYRQEHPGGLTRQGILAVINRVMFGGVADALTAAQDQQGISQALPAPDLNEAGIGHAPLGTWKPRRR